MTAIFGKLRTHFVNWRGWELNPIVIKELRQGVRSWTVTGMLLLFLVVLFMTSLALLISESFDVNPNMGMGGTMFTWFVGILAIASVFFIPLYTGVRVAAERQDNNPDLLYVSTLSPARIIFGKFLCSAYIVVLFFSACMPFMAFTNLLRGVDLPTVFFILFCLFLVVCAANMTAIFLACLPVSRPFKILFAIYGIFQSFGIVVPGMTMAFEIMRSGVGAMMSRKDFWISTATFTGIDLMLIGFLFVLSVALISPQSANRALPVRIFFTVVWLLTGLLALCWVVQTGDAGRIWTWTLPTFIVMMLALLVTISNADNLSLRVRRTIPTSPWLRPLAFLFFNGAAGGLVWVAAILAATYGLAKGVMTVFPKAIVTGTFDEESTGWFMATIFYAFAYSLTAVYIHRRFMPRRPAKLTGLLAILLAGGWAIAPSIFMFFANQLSWKSVEGLQLGNVFNVYFNRDSTQLIYHRYFAIAWLCIMLAVNAGWFFRQARNFRRPEKIETPPENVAVPPVLNA